MFETFKDAYELGPMFMLLALLVYAVYHYQNRVQEVKEHEDDAIADLKEDYEARIKSLEAARDDWKEKYLEELASKNEELKAGKERIRKSEEQAMRILNDVREQLRRERERKQQQ